MKLIIAVMTEDLPRMKLVKRHQEANCPSYHQPRLDLSEPPSSPWWVRKPPQPPVRACTPAASTADSAHTPPAVEDLVGDIMEGVIVKDPPDILQMEATVIK